MGEPSNIGRLARDENGSAVLSCALLIFVVGRVVGAGASLYGVTLKDLIGTTASTIDEYVSSKFGAT